MIKTKTIKKFLSDKLNEIGDAHDPKYTFEIFTEAGKTEDMFFRNLIQGRLTRTMASLPATVAINEATLKYSLDLIIPTPKGSNEQLLAVTEIIDKLSNEINRSYQDLDNGQALLVLDGSITQGFIEKGASVGEHLILTFNVDVSWIPHVIANQEPITKDQLKIKLIQRTPYHNRIIDINEPDNVVFEFNSTIVGWYHNEVAAMLKIYLPAPFVSPYNYIEVTEFSGNKTHWFILKREFEAPNVWVHTLKRDVIRDKWTSIENAECMVERGYLKPTNPLYYKSENISGNITLGKRTKLLDSNLILAYVKTFNIQNNLGSAIPEGYWKVQAGMPGFKNAPIITEEIPNTINIIDGKSEKTPNALLRMFCFMGNSGAGSPARWVDSNREYDKEVFSRNSFNITGGGGSTSAEGAPNSITLDSVAKSLNGYISYVADKNNNKISSMPLWFFDTRGFGSNDNRVFPTNYECVINKGTTENPEFYKLIFSKQTKTYSVDINAKSSDRAEIDKFISKTGLDWIVRPSVFGEKYVEGKVTYHTYKIEQQFLADAKPNDETASKACYTFFPATSIQTTSGAYSYNIFAFKVNDNGQGFEENYKNTVNSNSGQMILSSLMSTGVGVGNKKDKDGQEVEIPSLAGQIVDLQMCPFDENSINNLIDSVYPIYKGTPSENDAVTEEKIKVGEYYLLNSQDVECFINYDLTDWKAHGNNKSRVDLSQMRLVCPNNSSIATLNPDIMTNDNILQFKMNGTLYPYKPVYKVTPMAHKSLIYASQEARDNMLVLGGDFSATQVSSAWSDYLIGNKNVEESQQASIANQTMNQQLQYEQQLKSINTQGSMQMNAALLGIMGGVAGFNIKDSFSGLLGLLGGTTGLMNIGTNTQLQKEGLQTSQTIFNNNIALNQKLFNLQMGNIKAMPNTIHKITNGSYDNDYSVMIEEYYSTDIEYEQYTKTLQKTGMSVNCIGKLTDYINPNYFVFCQMIKCGDIDNFNVFDEINKELQNGLKLII